MCLCLMSLVQQVHNAAQTTYARGVNVTRRCLYRNLSLKRESVGTPPKSTLRRQGAE